MKSHSNRCIDCGRWIIETDTLPNRCNTCNKLKIEQEEK